MRQNGHSYRPNKETVYLSQKEIDRLINSSDTLVVRTVFYVGYQLALRAGEVLVLSPSSFDFKRHLAKVWDEKKDKVREEGMTEDTEAMLKLYIAEKRLRPEEKLFPYSEKTLTRWIRKYAKKAGIEWDERFYNLRWHSLRHSRIRNWFEEGYSVNFVSAMTGDTAKVLWEVYGKLIGADTVRILRGKERFNG